MKFFLDTANVNEIRTAAELGILDGVTTNPSLIAKEGVPVEEQVRRICEVIDGDVSAEVIALTSREMIDEGRRLARIHKNVVVKVPLIREGIKAVSALSRDGIRTNVTLCFSAAQALVAAKAGAAMVSPFVGRVEDIGWPGMDLIRDVAAIYRQCGFNTEILAASVRGSLHVIEAAKSGAHIVTVTPKVLDQLLQHPLTEKGLEQFLADHNKAFETMHA